MAMLIPLDRLPMGTQFHVRAGNLVELHTVNPLIGELIIHDHKSAPSEVANLSPAQMVEFEYGEMSIKEAAQALGISKQAVLQAVKRDALVYRQVGSMYLIDAASVRAYTPRGRRGSATASTKLPEG